MSRNGTKNLKPANLQSKEEASRNGRKGGINSGIARREKKAFKELLETALNAAVKVADESGAEKNVTLKEKVVDVLIRKAVKQMDINAIKFIFEVMGEKPIAEERFDHEQEKEPIIVEIIDSREKVEIPNWRRVNATN